MVKCVCMPKKKLQRININFLTIISENDVNTLPFYFFMHYTSLKTVGIMSSTNWQTHISTGTMYRRQSRS